MRRLVCSDYGPLDGLAFEECPDPVPVRDEILIRIEATGLNWVDTLMAQGRHQIKPRLPYVPASEVAGTVVAAGPRVTRFAVGDRVMATCLTGGCATSVAVVERACRPLPPNLTAAQGATVNQSYGTAMYGLTRASTVHPGDWVVVLGAGGGIGLAFTDVASALGARVIAAASSVDKLKAAEGRGATALVNYTESDLATSIRDIVGDGVAMVADPVGGAHAADLLRSLGFGGRYLVVGFAGGEIPKLAANLVLLKNRSVVGVEWGSWAKRYPERNVTLLAELDEMLASGRLDPVTPEEYRLDDAVEALSALAERRVTGKLVLLP